VFLCLGGAALVAPVPGDLAELRWDLGALVLMSVIAAVFIRTARTITRVEGGVALAAYVAFVVSSIARG
jgi:Ca2+/Na+ antiporter